MNNEKHGIPALLSFFICGLGQLTKNHFGKFTVFFATYLIALYLMFSMVFSQKGHIEVDMYLVCFIPLIVWFWSINDAYNSNTDFKIDSEKSNEMQNNLSDSEK